MTQTPTFDHPLDPTTRPQDDLYGHVNNSWLSSVEIPADKGRYGVFDVLRERSEEDVRAIVEEAAADPGSDPDARLIGGLFSSFMDEEAVEAAGLAPLRPRLDEVDAVDDARSLLVATGRLGRLGVGGLLAPIVATDDGNPDEYVVYLEQSGLGLPDESYYRDEQHAAVLRAYRGHVETLLSLAGTADAGSVADAVLRVEHRLATGHLDRVNNRDAVATYNPMTADELAQAAPSFDWAAWAQAWGMPEGALDRAIARQPDYLRSLSAALDEVDVADWRAWLRWHVVLASAPHLGRDLVAAHFDLAGRTLSGIPEQRARWKRGVSLLEGALGDAVGKLYVERHYPPESQAAMDELVEHLVEAFRRSFASLSWMSDETKAEALAKLESFTPKVGAPVRWKDYSALQLSGDLLTDVGRANALAADREIGKLGGPVDRDEWFMTPQTVNAYYNPGMNEIVFPAAILQPPFFDADADPAANYGGIGAVIGHEIGHGFDDSGASFDGTGALRDWWTPQDKEAFTALADRLRAQFDGQRSRTAPDRAVNGALTVGENIGDIGGLAIGHAAYRIAVGEEAATSVGDDGLTGDQRFFVSWARVWCGDARREEAERLLAIDPHAPQDLRGNACRNIDAFHEAFEVAEGDGMWLDPADRVLIF
ncbi:M13 family metallopeptidase [Janibacter melonis]|uniref:M13 family metallopeptidase n=1 Tax=Janibacter melonis TaxID=262209 RepID=UPI00174D14B3|nr:M13-type metalloendopeptidase [Janibacter melonis]